MAAPEKYVCAKCGRSTRSATKPLLQSTGKCPKATNGNHSWHKEPGNSTQAKYMCVRNAEEAPEVQQSLCCNQPGNAPRQRTETILGTKKVNLM